MSSKQVALIRPRRELRRKLCGVQQFLDIDSRFVSQPVQEGHEIFGSEVAAGSGTVRTTAQTGRGGIELANPSLQTGERVGQAAAIGVMEMERDLAGRNSQFFSN